jgi:hypothetical protein
MTLEAQRARMRAAKQRRNSLALRAARLLPRPFCACSSRAIKEAIAELPPAEKTTLANWLNAQDSEAWDRQIEADFSEGGAGMALLHQWAAEAGESMPLEEFLTERQN